MVPEWYLSVCASLSVCLAGCLPVSTHMDVDGPRMVVVEAREGLVDLGGEVLARRRRAGETLYPSQGVAAPPLQPTLQRGANRRAGGLCGRWRFIPHYLNEALSLIIGKIQKGQSLITRESYGGVLKAGQAVYAAVGWLELTSWWAKKDLEWVVGRCLVVGVPTRSHSLLGTIRVKKRMQG
jgi:hypothetical protein